MTFASKRIGRQAMPGRAFFWAELRSKDFRGLDNRTATAKKGKKTAEHQTDGFIALLRDMTAFSLSRLHDADADQVR